MVAITAMAAVIATWLVLCAACTGVGALLLRAAGARVIGADRVLMASVLGLGAAIAFLQLWHFWRPVDMAAGICLLASGVTGLLGARHDLQAAARRLSQSRTLLLCLMLAVIWLANHALGAGDATDSGAYQYQAVRWSHAYPVVPGLANLDYRLGLASSSFLVQALLDTAGSPWHQRAHHIVNGWFLLPLAGLAVVGFWRAWTARQTLRSLGPADAFGVLLIVPVFMLSLSRELTSPRTDLPTALFAMFAVWRLLALLTSRDRDAQRVDLLFVAVAAAVLPTLKLSMTVLGASLWITAAGFWVWSARPVLRRAMGPLTWSVVLSFAIVAPWLVRGYILSGYPLFPSAMFAPRAEWRLPPEARLALEADARDWAVTRQPALAAKTLRPHLPAGVIALLDGSGSPPGVSATSGAIAWALSAVILWPIEAAAPAVLVVLALMRRTRGAPRPDYARARLAVLPVAAGVLSWCLVAPLPRYGYSALWASAAVVWALRWPAFSGRRGWRVVCGAIVVLLLGTMAHRVLGNRYLYRAPLLHRLLWVSGGPDRGFHPRPRTFLRPVTNTAGLTIWVPMGQGLLWDSPLLSTLDPELAGPLRLRVDGDVSRGFRAEGQ